MKTIKMTATDGSVCVLVVRHIRSMTLLQKSSGKWHLFIDLGNGDIEFEQTATKMNEIQNIIEGESE